jgi:hypothetical protein
VTTRRMSNAVLLAMAMASGLVANEARAQSVSEDEFRWTGRVAAGGSVEIRGVNGGIEALPSTDGQVSVVAVKRGRRSSPADVRIDVVEHAGGVTICAVYPSRDGAPNECAPQGGRMSTHDNDVEVGFTVHVPTGVPFAARTVNGAIRARGLGSRVHARTVNGSITVETTGACDAETVNGSITATFSRLDPASGVTFKTVNGGITLSLPAETNATVDATTVNGSFESDLPLTLQGRLNRRRFEGTLGSGGPRLAMKTVNGGITLRRR